MYKTKFQKKAILAAICAFSSVSIMAQEGGVVSLGAVDIIPSLNIQATHDDNIRSVENNTVSDTIVTIAPSISAQIDNGISGFTFDYGLTKGEYLSESAESFLSQNFGASFGWNVFDTHVVTLSANLLDAHDARTPDAPSGLGRDDLDEYEDTTYTFNYSYGDRSQFLGYSLTASLFDKAYKTNRETSGGFVGTKFDDRETENVNAQVNFNVSDALQLNVLYGLSKSRYVEDSSVTLDSDQESYGLGFDWGFSDALDLSVSFSKVERDLINDAAAEISKSDRYNVSGTYSPYSYSRYSLSLTQAINEPSSTSADGEDFVEVQSAQIAWAHDWTDVLSTNLSYASSENDYVGSSSNRVDESNTVAASMSYQLRSSVALSFNVSQASRDGTATSPKSDKTAVTLGAAFTL